MERYTKKDIPKLEKLKREFGRLIKAYSSFYSRSNRKPTRLLSEYGEVTAQLKLLKKFDIKLPGGQSKADLTIINRKNGIEKNIEVKTSSYKKEDYGEGWGAALNIKKCKKHPNKRDFCYFDYLIFIALDKRKFSPKFYIFTREEIERKKKHLRNKSKRFKKSTHRLCIPKILNENGKKFITEFDKGLYKNKKYLGRWDKIKAQRRP